MKKHYQHIIKPISELIPYAMNARTHSPEQITQIAASIAEFGFTNPVLIDEKGGIVAGHGRVESAQKLGLEDIPCIILTGLTEAQKKAYILADNQLPLNAGWDLDLLKLEIESLAEMDFNLDLIGFDDEFLNGLLEPEPSEGLTDPDEIPEAPEEPITKLGDVWLLGNHRLMCGDSTNIQHIDVLMNQQKADYCFTSPPYGQQRAYDDLNFDWDELMQGVFSILPVKDGAQVLVNLGLIHEEKQWSPYWNRWLDHMVSIGWLRFALYVWDQGPGMPGDHGGRLAPSFELIFHFCKQPKKAVKTVASKHGGKTRCGKKGQRDKDGKVENWSGDGVIHNKKVNDSVIRINRQNNNNNISKEHPARFPVALVDTLCAPWCKLDDIIFEPFCGSGTSIISAEKNGYYCYGMEISQKYCDIIIKRWQEFTGKEAVLESNNLTYNEMAEAI